MAITRQQLLATSSIGAWRVTGGTSESRHRASDWNRRADGLVGIVTLTPAVDAAAAPLPPPPPWLLLLRDERESMRQKRSASGVYVVLAVTDWAVSARLVNPRVSERVSLASPTT